MSTPHNRARRDELWNETRLAVLLEEIIAMRDHVVLSGGWEWAFHDSG